MTTKAHNGGGTLHRLERKQVVHGTIDEVFGFFKDPKNLEALTPPWLNFEVRTYSTPRVRLETVIQYRLRWKLFPMTWRSRISEYEHNALFAAIFEYRARAIAMIFPSTTAKARRR